MKRTLLLISLLLFTLIAAGAGLYTFRRWVSAEFLLSPTWALDCRLAGGEFIIVHRTPLPGRPLPRIDLYPLDPKIRWYSLAPRMWFSFSGDLYGVAASWILRFPAWPVPMVSATALVIFYRRRPVPIGMCPTCGYDLRASAGRCPECGTEISSDPASSL